MSIFDDNDDDIEQFTAKIVYENDSDSKPTSIFIDNKYIKINDAININDIKDYDVNVDETSLTLGRYIKKAQNIKDKYYYTLLALLIFAIMGNSALSEYLDYKPTDTKSGEKKVFTQFFMYFLSFVTIITVTVVLLTAVIEYVAKVILFSVFGLTYLDSISVSVDVSSSEENVFYLKNRDLMEDFGESLATLVLDQQMLIIESI